MDKVLQLSSEEPRVLDGIDFLLLMVIDEIMWRWWIDVVDGKMAGRYSQRRDSLKTACLVDEPGVRRQ